MNNIEMKKQIGKNSNEIRELKDAVEMLKRQHYTKDDIAPRKEMKPEDREFFT